MSIAKRGGGATGCRGRRRGRAPQVVVRKVLEDQECGDQHRQQRQHDLQKMSNRNVTKYLAAIGRLATTMNDPNPIARPFWWLPLSATPTAHPIRQSERRRARVGGGGTADIVGNTVAPAWGGREGVVRAWGRGAARGRGRDGGRRLPGARGASRGGRRRGRRNEDRRHQHHVARVQREDQHARSDGAELGHRREEADGLELPVRLDELEADGGRQREEEREEAGAQQEQVLRVGAARLEPLHLATEHRLARSQRAVLRDHRVDAVGVGSEGARQRHLDDERDHQHSEGNLRATREQLQRAALVGGGILRAHRRRERRRGGNRAPNLHDLHLVDAREAHDPFLRAASGAARRRRRRGHVDEAGVRRRRRRRRRQAGGVRRRACGEVGGHRPPTRAPASSASPASPHHRRSAACPRRRRSTRARHRRKRRELDGGLALAAPRFRCVLCFADSDDALERRAALDEARGDRATDPVPRTNTTRAWTRRRYVTPAMRTRATRQPAIRIRLGTGWSAARPARSTGR